MPLGTFESLKGARPGGKETNGERAGGVGKPRPEVLKLLKPLPGNFARHDRFVNESSCGMENLFLEIWWGWCEVRAGMEVETLNGYKIESLQWVRGAWPNRRGLRDVGGRAISKPRFAPTNVGGYGGYEIVFAVGGRWQKKLSGPQTRSAVLSSRDAESRVKKAGLAQGFDFSGVGRGQTRSGMDVVDNEADGRSCSKGLIFRRLGGFFRIFHEIFWRRYLIFQGLGEIPTLGDILVRSADCEMRNLRKEFMKSLGILKAGKMEEVKWK